MRAAGQGHQNCPGDLLRCLGDQVRGDGAAQRIADHGRLLDPDGVHEVVQTYCEVLDRHGVLWFGAAAEAWQVGHVNPERVGQPGRGGEHVGPRDCEPVLVDHGRGAHGPAHPIANLIAVHRGAFPGELVLGLGHGHDADVGFDRPVQVLGHQSGGASRGQSGRQQQLVLGRAHGAPFVFCAGVYAGPTQTSACRTDFSCGPNRRVALAPFTSSSCGGRWPMSMS